MKPPMVEAPFPRPVPLWMRARDPLCVVVFWQTDPEALDLYLDANTGGSWRLRLAADHPGTPLLHDAVLPLDRDHEFVVVANAGETYVAEIGFLDIRGSWRPLARATAVTTPSEKPPQPGTFLPTPARSQEVRRPQLPPAPSPTDPHPIAKQEQESASIPAIARRPFTDATGPAKAVPEVLWSLIREPDVTHTGPSSETVTEWTARAVGVPVPKAHATIPSSTDVLRGDLAAPSSAELPTASERDFWFEVNAELILYGRTRPDARVTLDGQPVVLRRDGSFRFQFSLPDGRYALPVVAVSAAGDDSRAAHLEFSRATCLQGPVGQHPQDPMLHPPGAAPVR
ncbi:MAG: DUF4912 domain-containing protein [Verrucomicrobiae bacterium]|nr:DUF4912 domain-containing protein [Verrucomicrobiae bacterium]